MKDERLYVSHMLDCIEKIESCTAPGYGAFETESMIQIADNSRSERQLNSGYVLM